jgi:hypothetical protein
MEWNTLYIKGKSDFRGEVRKKLDDSDIDFMPGFMDSPGTRSDMYWISDQTSIVDVKEALGAKVIWKYRLRFYDTLESLLEEESNKTKRIKSQSSSQAA